MTSLKVLGRRRRIIELRCLGFTIPQITQKLNDEGGKVSEITVWRDLHSTTVEDYIEELKRKQLADITLCEDDYATRLKYRDLLLDKLMPRSQRIEGVAGLILEWARPEEKSQSNTADTVADNICSMSQKQDSDASHVGVDGVKPAQAQTKPSDKPSYAA